MHILTSIIELSTDVFLLRKYKEIQFFTLTSCFLMQIPQSLKLALKINLSCREDQNLNFVRRTLYFKYFFLIFLFVTKLKMTFLRKEMRN